MTTKDLSIRLPISLTKPKELLAFIGLSCLSFAIPFSLGHPQWLVGSIVNACLFSSAYFLNEKYFFPLVVFPSLAVLARGVIFGPLTPFLIYFLPFLWAGNLILILLFKKFYKYNQYLSLTISAVVKYLFLLIVASIYFKFRLVPQVFVQTMGLYQLYTALIGGLVFIIISNLWKLKHQK